MLEQRFVNTNPYPGNSLEGDSVTQRGMRGPELVRQGVGMNGGQCSDMLRVCRRVWCVIGQDQEGLVSLPRAKLGPESVAGAS